MVSVSVVAATYSANSWTAIIGNKDAKVTIPKPDREEDFLPTDEEIPIPKASTKGTVTGPVVTAPQSQAKPKIVFRYSLVLMYKLRPSAGIKVKKISFFKPQP